MDVSSVAAALQAALAAGDTGKLQEGVQVSPSVVYVKEGRNSACWGRSMDGLLRWPRGIEKPMMDRPTTAHHNRACPRSCWQRRCAPCAGRPTRRSTAGRMGRPSVRFYEGREEGGCCVVYGLGWMVGLKAVGDLLISRSIVCCTL